MMRPILASDMPSAVSPSTPGVIAPWLAVDTPVGQFVQLRVEQLPVEFVRRQATPAAFTEDTQYRFGVSAFRIPPGLRISSHLAPFARLWTAFPPSLVRRYSHDYYGACVTLGLAPLRRSHVRPCHT